MTKGILKLIIFILLLSSYSCTKGDESTLVVCVPTELKNIYKPGEYEIDNLLFASLFAWDDKGNRHDILIEETKHSEDKRTWTVILRKEFRFHNGKEITAKDIIFSIREELSKKPEIQRKIKNIRAEGKNVIGIEFESPVFDIHNILWNVYAYPEGTVPLEGLPFELGSGPYCFDKKAANRIELAANDSYPEGRPKIDRMIFTWERDERKRLYMLLKGETDLLCPVSPEIARFLSNDKRFYVNATPSFYYVALFLNNKSPLFDDKGVRRAVNMAIDRDLLIEKALDGAGIKASGPFLPGMWEADPKVTYPYAPMEALRLLKSAGWTDGDGILKRGGKVFNLRLLYVKEMGELKKVADMIAQYLFEVGIRAEVVPVPQDELFGRIYPSGDYDGVLAVFNTGEGIDGPSRVWSTNGVYNLSNYSNPKVDSLLEEGRKAGEIREKKRILNRIHEIIHDDAPAAFLYHPLWYTAVNKRFKGAEDFKGDPYSWYRIKDWSLNENPR